MQTLDTQTTFTPEQLAEACQTALDAWDWNPEDYVEEWEEDAEKYVANMQLVLRQIIDKPNDFMDDEEEDGQCFNLEHHPPHKNIWDYLNNRCTGFANLWTKGENP